MRQRQPPPNTREGPTKEDSGDRPRPLPPSPACTTSSVSASRAVVGPSRAWLAVTRYLSRCPLIYPAIALLLAYLAVLCFSASTTLQARLRPAAHTRLAPAQHRTRTPCNAPQAEALFLHRVSRVWPPCDLAHPGAGPAVAWLPWTSRLLQLSEGLPRTDAHRLPIGDEGGGGWAGLWHTRPDPACQPPPSGDGGLTWVLHLHGNGEARCWAKTVRRAAALLAAPPEPQPRPQP